ncbi:venom protein 302-like isoform X1 [Palaemon carinicauda]|uniref:venom protein 302-like isoform X1 n=1 Tax=Palaemon carinicauda TaxID=392227 RepID=UPI0035B5C544
MASAFVKGLSIVVCLVTLIKSTEGLSCSYCDYDAACPKGHLTESDCPFGVVKDICQCCDTCAKGPGEKCGGYWGEFGTCGRNHTCKWLFHRLQLSGTCV